MYSLAARNMECDISLHCSVTVFACLNCETSDSRIEFRHFLTAHHAMKAYWEVKL